MDTQSHNESGSVGSDDYEEAVLRGWDADDTAMLRELAEQFRCKGTAKATAMWHRSLGMALHLEGSYNEAIQEHAQALALFTENNDHRSVARGHISLGLSYRVAGFFPEALEHSEKARILSINLGELRTTAEATNNIGIIYVATGNYPEAMKFFQLALEQFSDLGLVHGVGRTTMNIGLVYQATRFHDDALEHFRRALDVFTELQDRDGIATTTSNIGTVFHYKQDYSTGLEYYQKALALYKTANDYHGMGNVLEAMVNIHIKQERWEEAETTLHQQTPELIATPSIAVNNYCHRARLLAHQGKLNDARETLLAGLTIAVNAGIAPHVATIQLNLRDLALKQNDLALYVEHNNEYTRITEEINGKQTTQRLAMMEAEKRIEAERAEKEKHRALLYGALPQSVADRLIRGEKVSGDHFDAAAVLFTDVVGFTSHTSSMHPGDVVALLANMFSAFDKLCEEYGVIKVKTIGDSYMCFKGDGDATTNARSITSLALFLQGACGTWSDGTPIQIRIGIHVGPATAGVIGTERLQYDVWGDTVNVASRMESYGSPGKVNISSVVADILSVEAGFALKSQGQIEIKGKGLMEMYSLEGV